MTIDFIKWMIRYAEGFELVNREGRKGFCHSDGYALPFDFDFSKNKKWDSTYKSLLLQKAIEGCLLHFGYHQIINGEGFWLVKGSDEQWFEAGENGYEKESALEYIYKQEIEE